MSNTPKIVTRRKTGSEQKTDTNFNFSKENLPELENPRLSAYRHSAWQDYERLPFPNLQNEAWRRTDIRDLKLKRFEIANSNQIDSNPPERLLNPIIAGDGRSGQIVSGAVETKCSLDPELEKKGVVFTDFHSAELNYPDLVGQIIGDIVSPNEDKFTALAAALASDGVFLYVPKNVVIDQPLHSLYWGAGDFQAFMNHLVIWVEDGGQVTFVHESASASLSDDTQMLHNGIVEIYVGRNARLNFVELQSWGNNVWSFTRERARVMRDGTLEWIFGAVGTQMTKNFSDIDLLEPGAVGRMSGFYFASGIQHLDHDTQQNHYSAHTTSDLLYKGALMDASRSVWQGMIYVAPGAVGTDGYQANRNLILSKSARADSIPGLEILADDVRCTHAATVGKIDEEELFYLLSRGIPKKEAEQLIVKGFFEPIMARIPFEGVQARFTEAIQEKMAGR